MVQSRRPRVGSFTWRFPEIWWQIKSQLLVDNGHGWGGQLGEMWLSIRERYRGSSNRPLLRGEFPGTRHRVPRPWPAHPAYVSAPQCARCCQGTTKCKEDLRSCTRPQPRPKRPATSWAWNITFTSHCRRLSRPPKLTQRDHSAAGLSQHWSRCIS